MAGCNPRLTLEIGDRPGHFQDPRPGPGAEAELFHGHFQEPVRLGIQGTELADLPGRHPAVAENAEALEPLLLDLPGGVDAALDLRRGFAAGAGRQLPVFHRGDFDVNVDAVQERPGNLRPVLSDLPGRAPALPAGVPVVPAGAGVC